MTKNPDERFVVHFCFTEPHEQIVSVTTRLGEPFEIALWQLESEKVDNVLVGKLTHSDDQLEFRVQGNLYFSGIGYGNPHVVLDKPFSIPTNGKLNAVIVTRAMDRTLEYQIDEKYVSVPSERAELVNKLARPYLVSARAEMLKTRKAQLEKELVEIDDALNSENTG